MEVNDRDGEGAPDGAATTGSPGPARPSGRPADGRWVSGTALWAAERFGVGVGTARIAFLLLALVGSVVATTVLLFDTALFGEPLSDPTRLSFAGLGTLATLLYPLLSLVLPSRSRTHWDFGSAFGAILLLVLLGQAVGTLIDPWWRVAKHTKATDGVVGWFVWPAAYHERIGFGGRDLVIAAFLVSTAAFLWLQRASVRSFFRSMHVGVSLVTLSLVATAVGVLVPQIDGFEDPEQRVNLDREYQDYLAFQRDGYQKLPRELEDGHEQYQAFRWAEGYFVYHLLHLYGWRMPPGELTPRMVEGLDVFGRKYGTEERDNREKQMRAAFSGRAKVEEIGEFVHANEPAFWRAFQVSTWLQLNRTYKSAWFAALLWLLGVAIAFNTFKGRPKQWFSIQKLGYFTVHVGMLVLLFGGFVSKLETDRGILHLHKTMEPQDVYWGHFDPAKKRQLPFALRLEHFARQDWPSLEVQFLDEEAERLSSRPPTYTLWEGRRVDLDLQGEDLRPRVRIDVRAMGDRVEIRRPQLRELPPGEPGGMPMAAVVLEEQGVERQLYLPPVDYGIAPPLTDRAQSFRLAAANAEDPLAFFPQEQGYVGGLEVRIVGEGDGAPHTHAARIGETTELPGGYRMTVVDATADLDVKRDEKVSRHPLPLERQPLRRPAVWVDLRGPDGTEERRAVIQGIHARDLGAQDSFELAEVELRFDWDEWGAPGAPRYLLNWTSDRPAELIAETGERSPVELGLGLELPGEMSVRPIATYHSATFEPDIELLPPVEAVAGWDADFYHRGARGTVLDVTLDPGTPAERSFEVPMATSDEFRSNVWIAPDESFAMRFFENDRMLPYEWRSVLQVYERNGSDDWQLVDLGSEAAREIRVNDYFSYGGYRFFQTNANPEDPGYSGIGVVYDPGIPWVLAGMYIVIAGTAIAFLVRPIVVAGRERKKLAILSEGAAGSSSNPPNPPGGLA